MQIGSKNNFIPIFFVISLKMSLLYIDVENATILLEENPF